MNQILKEPFSRYRSFLQHKVKNNELETILYILDSEIIRQCEKDNNFLFAFYTLALLDLLCQKHGYDLCSDYDDLRKLKLATPFYVGETYLLKNYKETREYIPEFLKYNIFEVLIYDVC